MRADLSTTSTLYSSRLVIIDTLLDPQQSVNYSYNPFNLHTLGLCFKNSDFNPFSIPHNRDNNLKP